MHIRPYKEGDELSIIKLDALVEEHPWNRRNLANWIWKYKGENPAGKALIWVAEDKNNILATFAIIPIMYFIKGQIIKGSHSIAMIVHPEWQRKGLIKFIADKLINDAINNKIIFTYGYPNERAYELHKQLLGYKDISGQNFYYYNFLQNKKKITSIMLDNYVFKEIKKFDISVDELWDTVKGKFNVALIRKKEFLNWRYVSRPDVKYFPFGIFKEKKLLGYCVLKLYKEDKILRGHFIDIFADPKDKVVFHNMVVQSMLFFQKKGCQEVNLWLQGSNLFQNIFKEIGFFISGSRPMICRFNLNSENFEKILTKENWYFTMGDTFEIY